MNTVAKNSEFLSKSTNHPSAPDPFSGFAPQNQRTNPKKVPTLFVIGSTQPGGSAAVAGSRLVPRAQHGLAVPLQLSHLVYSVTCFKPFKAA